MLHVFNRVVVSLILAALAMLAVYTLSVTLGIANPDPALVGPVVAAELDQLADLDGTAWWTALASLLAGSVAVAYALLWELRPDARARQPFLIERTQLGSVTVERRSIIQLVEQAVRALPEVRDVRVRVGSARGGILVGCVVSAVPSAVLTELGEQVQTVAKARIKEQTGLEVIDVATKMNFDAFRTERRVLD